MKIQKYENNKQILPFNMNIVYVYDDDLSLVQLLTYSKLRRGIEVIIKMILLTSFIMEY